MASKLDPGVSVVPNGLSTGARMAKNSAALFVVAMLTKGSGLIVAMMVARYLGPAALGIYASVMGIGLLLETITPLGQPFVIIRQVARDRSNLLGLWLNTSLATILFSLLLSGALVVFASQVGDNQEYLRSTIFVALYLPISGLYAIAQAIVQGVERMEQLTISAFIARIVGLLILWLLLQTGLGVSAAFLGYGLYQLIALLILVWAILREAEQSEAIRETRPDFAKYRSTLRLSIPFAAQTFLKGALLQISVLILPLLVSMENVGMFDASDRIRQTSAMIIPIVTLAILPTLSRTSLTDRESTVSLLEMTYKVLQVVILPFVVFVAIAADQIIPLLYGPGYDAAIPLLRIVIWAQIFFVTDAVMNQIMMASDNEVPMVRRTAFSLGLNVILLLVFVPLYGITAAAWAVVITIVLNLALDIQFVFRHITHLNLIGILKRPVFCAALSGLVAFTTRDLGLWVSLALFIFTYSVLLWLVKVFSKDEFHVALQILSQLWHRIMKLTVSVFRK